MGIRYSGAIHLPAGGFRVTKALPPELIDFSVAPTFQVQFNNSWDDSVHPRTPTVTGAPAFSSTTSKFGTHAGKFGIGERLTYPSLSGNAVVGGGDFTMEGWLNTSTATSGDNGTMIMSYYQGWTQNNGSYRVRWQGGRIAFDATNGTWSTNTKTVLSAANSVLANEWVHWAVVRDADSVKIYINGEPSGDAVDFTGYTLNSPTIPLTIGGNNDDWDGHTFQYGNGYLDDMRIYKGVRYTGSFRPQDWSSSFSE